MKSSFNNGLVFRHDCQDGSDEYDCDFSSMTVSRQFLCYTGRDHQHHLTDCIKDEDRQQQHNVVTSVLHYYTAQWETERVTFTVFEDVTPPGSTQCTIEVIDGTEYHVER